MSRRTFPSRGGFPYRRLSPREVPRMLAPLRSKLSFANVTAALALFIALGGTGYAAATLPRNSVGSNQIRAGAVGSSELKRGAVSSRAIRNRSVELTDLSANARASLRG